MTQVEKRSAACAVGAKTARACDSCLRRRARWYCAADDAFLCQGCDSSVHSANPLARRHERVRLKTSSSSPASTFTKAAAVAATTHVVDDDYCDEPTWHHGFKRKARTPRGGGGGFHRSPKGPEQKEGMEDEEVIMNRIATDPLVPDLETAYLEDFAAAEEEQLLYRVPIFDPVLAEFCSPPASSYDDVKPSAAMDSPPQPDHLLAATPVQGVSGFLLPSDMDLAEFEIDVENILGQDLDGDAFCMEGLGLISSRDDGCAAAALAVKEEDVEEDDDNMSVTAGGRFNIHMDLSRDTFDISFDCGSPTGDDASEGEEKPAVAARADAEGFGEVKKRKIMLKLDYEAVISAWSVQGCPWTNGERPQFNPDNGWPDYMGMAWGGGGGGEVQGGAYGGDAVSAQGAPAAGGVGDGGREARVSRYREKRRTRLFSKKIRYEVRKLNAEKRPRMRGRFVKRTSFNGEGVPGGAAVALPQFAF